MSDKKEVVTDEEVYKALSTLKNLCKSKDRCNEPCCLAVIRNGKHTCGMQVFTPSLYDLRVPDDYRAFKG